VPNVADPSFADLTRAAQHAIAQHRRRELNARAHRDRQRELAALARERRDDVRLAARWAVADATRRTDPARAEALDAQVRAAGHTHAGHADADARADVAQRERDARERDQRDRERTQPAITGAEAAAAALAVTYLLEAASDATAEAVSLERDTAELVDLAHPHQLRDVLNAEHSQRVEMPELPPTRGAVVAETGLDR
jgi:hypothetical protein